MELTGEFGLENAVKEAKALGAILKKAGIKNPAPSELTNLPAVYYNRVISGQWTVDFAAQQLDALIVKFLPVLRYFDIPCETSLQVESTTLYDFTDVDKNDLAMGWATIQELKDREGDYQELTFRMGSDTPSKLTGPLPARLKPKDWAKEERLEYNFLAIISYLSQHNQTGDMMFLMDKMVRHKAQFRGQWITKVPGFVEVGQTVNTFRKRGPEGSAETQATYTQGGRIPGWATLNGRFRYAIGRAGTVESYFYIMSGEMSNAFRDENRMLYFQDNSGRTEIEPNPPGHKIGGPPVITTRPLDICAPPLGPGQVVMSIVQATVTFAVYFLTSIANMMMCDIKGIISLAVGTVTSLATGEDATPGVVKDMQASVSGSDAAYRLSVTASDAQNSMEKILFAEDGIGYAETLAGVGAQSSDAKKKADVAAIATEQHYEPTPVYGLAPAVKLVGWADRLFGKV